MADKLYLYGDCRVVDDGVSQYLNMGLDFGVFPKKTTAQINTLLPDEGRFVYDTTLKVFKVGNGSNFETINVEPAKSYLDWVVEDFTTALGGNAVAFTTGSASGGSVNGETPEHQPNWNDVTPKARLGQCSVRISNVANSRGVMFTGLNFRLFPTAEFGFASEQSIIGGQIDFATDPVLLCWGFLDSFAVNNPNNGVYFRCPRAGELPFLKYVVRIATVETVFSTSIPYDATNRRFVRTFIHWDGVNMNFIATDGVNASLNTIPNFLTTYAALATVNFAYGAFNARNGTGTTMIARNLNTDRVEKYYKSVFAA